ncbi:MAG TPA: YARHG domain-containing protein [Beijerinckiaceae bacterium]
MPKIPAHVLSVAVSVSSLIGASEAWAQSCGQLWYERNSIYKAAGYCFRTPRAIGVFGNAGCRYDSEYDVPLSARQRRRVEDIRAMERELGCPR